MMASAIGRSSAGSPGPTVGSQARRPSSVRAVASARLCPSMRLPRARAESRVPPQSGHVSSVRNFATRAMPFSSLAFESAFLTVFTAL